MGLNNSNSKIICNEEPIAENPRLNRIISQKILPATYHGVVETITKYRDYHKTVSSYMTPIQGPEGLSHVKVTGDTIELLTLDPTIGEYISQKTICPKEPKEGGGGREELYDLIEYVTQGQKSYMGNIFEHEDFVDTVIDGNSTLTVTHNFLKKKIDIKIVENSPKFVGSDLTTFYYASGQLSKKDVFEILTLVVSKKSPWKSR